MTSVSVVIGTYNRAALLKLTVESILKQTVRPLEILIVDNDSTDETQAYASNLPGPVRYIRQDNRGISGSRNRGIEEARGDFVALCDSDDLWNSRKLEKQLEAMRSTGARWSITGMRRIDPDGVPVGNEAMAFEKVFPVFADKRIAANEHFNNWLEPSSIELAGERTLVYAGDAFGLMCEGNVGLPSSAVMARSIFERLGGFDVTLQWAEDTEFFHRISAAFPLAIVMEPLVDYRVGHPSSLISSGNDEAVIRSAIEVARRVPKDRTLSAREAEALADGRRRLWTRLAYNRITELDGVGARKALMDGWKEGSIVSARAAMVLVLSLIPPVLLHALHRLKRVMRPLR